MKAASKEARRILQTFSDVVDWGIFHHVFMVLDLVGVSPLLPFHNGQRNTCVNHCANNVDEGYAQEGKFKELWSFIDCGSNQQAAGRPTLAAELIRRGNLAVRNEILGHCGIGDGIAHGWKKFVRLKNTKMIRIIP